MNSGLRPLRLCFVCDEYPPAMHGGIGSLIQSLARALVAQGHDVRVIGTKASTCKADTYEEDQGVKVWRQPPTYWSHAWPRSRYKIYQTVRDWCRRGELDLVEVVDFTGPAAMWPRLPVPVVARIHGSASYFASELNRRLTLHDFWIERASLRRADFLCAISGYAAERTRQVFSLGDRPITVLHDFVDAEAFSSHPAAVRSRSTVVYSGTLTAKKGVVELFDAWQQVVTRNRDARLHVYGKDSRNSDGRSMKEYLESRLEPAIRQTVQFHGHTPRHVLFAALAQARVGVFPSYSETFGLGPVESMAAGCPTIYGRCGCAEEIVNDRIDGILVNPREPQQIADAIVSVISDDQLAQRLGDGGRLRVQQQFTREIMLHRNEEFYRRSLAQYASRTATAPADSVSGAAIVEVARSRPELGNTAQVPVPEVVVLPLGIGNGGVSQPQ